MGRPWETQRNQAQFLLSTGHVEENMGWASQRSERRTSGTEGHMPRVLPEGLPATGDEDTQTLLFVLLHFTDSQLHFTDSQSGPD